MAASFAAATSPSFVLDCCDSRVTLPVADLTRTAGMLLILYSASSGNTGVVCVLMRANAAPACCAYAASAAAL